jgi:hypothetical protein
MNTPSTTLSLAAVLLSLLAAAPVVRAQNVAFTLNDLAVADLAQSGQGSGGSFFTVGATPINVTALGYYDYNAVNTLSAGPDLGGVHDVGIYQVSSQNLLTSVTVSNSTAALSNGFDYVQLTQPLTLAANTQYVIVGTDLANAVDPQNISGINASSGISFDGYRYINGTTELTFPTVPSDGTYYTPPYADTNFEYSVIPEPSTSAAVLGLATLGFTGLRRFRRRIR